MTSTLPELRDLKLFAACTKDELARARSLLTPIELPAGKVVWEVGRLGSDFAVIADGEVAVSDRNGAGVAVLGRGDIVGELALLDRSPRNATVMTLTPTVLYVGNVREFAGLLHVAPSVRERVVHGATARRERSA